MMNQKRNLNTELRVREREKLKEMITDHLYIQITALITLGLGLGVSFDSLLLIELLVYS